MDLNVGFYFDLFYVNLFNVVYVCANNFFIYMLNYSLTFNIKLSGLVNLSYMIRSYTSVSSTMFQCNFLDNKSTE